MTCVFGAEEGLERGVRFDMAGTATSEEPETHHITLVYIVTSVCIQSTPLGPTLCYTTINSTYVSLCYSRVYIQ